MTNTLSLGSVQHAIRTVTGILSYGLRCRWQHILTFFAYFDLPSTKQIVFITEIMTSGTLKQCASRERSGAPLEKLLCSRAFRVHHREKLLCG